ncbi:hypothetical protein Vadar_012453 [Vaccinium darrowii]|uniref:Uncharacterized protein n=1 Tax=Vaccinium darrowii TaxID=229202 RepID=A0ACB7XQH7_9ERIC|nr:hypothetical protein Vadar_012453 [Vaccinium darrowii]
MNHPPNSPAKTFYYSNLVLFSLHLAFLVHTFFSTNLLDLLSPFAASKINPSYSTFQLISTHPILFQFSYLISLFIFPLLSNIIINSSTVSNPRLLITHYFWASLTMYAYNAIAIGHLFIILAASSNAVLLFASGASFFHFLSTDDVSLWRHFMGSVFEPVSTVAAVKKSSRVIWVVNGIFMFLLMESSIDPTISVMPRSSGGRRGSSSSGSSSSDTIRRNVATSVAFVFCKRKI